MPDRPFRVEQVSFARGINNRVQAAFIGKEQISAGKNCVCEESGEVKSRGGFSPDATVSYGGAYPEVHALHEWQYHDTASDKGGVYIFHSAQLLSGDSAAASAIDVSKVSGSGVAILNKVTAPGVVTGISGAVVTGSNTAWLGAQLTVGTKYDKFYMATDGPSEAVAIASIQSDGGLTLASAYGGATSSGAFVIVRRIQCTDDDNLPRRVETVEVEDSLYIFPGHGGRLGYQNLDEPVTRTEGGIPVPAVPSAVSVSDAAGALTAGVYKLQFSYFDVDPVDQAVRWVGDPCSQVSVTVSAGANAISITDLERWYYDPTVYGETLGGRRIFRTAVGGTVAYLDTDLSAGSAGATSVVLTKADGSLDTGVTAPSDHDRSPEAFLCGAWHLGRLVAASYDYQSRGYYSGSHVDASGGLYEPLYWPVEGEVAAGVDALGNVDMPMAVVDFKERAYLFRRNGMWLLDDTKTDLLLWRWRQLRNDMGSIGKVARADDYIYFATARGQRLIVYRMSAGGLRDITGDLVHEFTEGYDPRADCFFVEDRLYVAVTEGSDHIPAHCKGGDLYSWHPKTGGWSPITDNPPILSVGRYMGTPRFMAAQYFTDRWKIGEPFAGADDDGAAIAFEVETRDIDGGARYRDRDKRYYYLEFEIESTSGFTLGLVSYSLDGAAYVALTPDGATNFICSAAERKMVRCELPEITGRRCKFKFALSEAGKDISIWGWNCDGVIEEPIKEPSE